MSEEDELIITIKKFPEESDIYPWAWRIDREKIDPDEWISRIQKRRALKSGTAGNSFTARWSANSAARKIRRREKRIANKGRIRQYKVK